MMRAAGDFTLLRPATLADATRLLAAPGARALAGGTDLLPNLRRGLMLPQSVIDLGGLPDFGAIRVDASGAELGAGATLAALARHAQLATRWPALAQAARDVAGPGHRSVATIGGNLCQDTRCVYYNQSDWWRAANDHCLKHRGSVCHVAPQGRRCHAAFEGDLAPALIACAAQIKVTGPTSTRQLPLEDLYRDDGAAHLALRAGEIITSIRLPLPAAGSANGYRKVRVRGAMDFPLAGVAIALRMQGAELASLRIGVSGTNSRPFLLDGTDTLLGRPVADGCLAALGKLVAKQVSPMRSTVTAANHRRLVAIHAAQHLLRELAQITTD